jgi:acetyltransferase-like isoleucine patch superfamily enzyme
VRAKLWLRTRRQPALLCAPIRISGRGANHALALIQIGEGTRIGPNAWFSLVDRHARITIGRNCTLGSMVAISARGSVTIGDGTTIADRTILMDHGHDHRAYLERAVEAGERPQFGWEITEAEPVVIGNGVHLGVNVVIQPGVHVGDGAIVGASSVVTRSVEPYTVVAGVPARPLRDALPDRDE